MNTNYFYRIKEIAWKTGLWMLLLTLAAGPVSVYAAEPGQDQKKVRVGYVNVANYEEGKEGEYKRGSGYEYLQRISYVTGWNYEYVYGSFKECYDMLVKGDIDLFGNISYKPERAELFDYSNYPQGRDTYLLYTTRSNVQFAAGDISRLNHCKIGVTEGSFQEGLLRDWIAANRIEAEILMYDGYESMMAALDAKELDAIATPDLATSYDYLPIVNIGFSDYYFAVSKSRPDILKELNEALYEIQNSEMDYNNQLVSRYHNKMSTNLMLNKKEEAWLAENDNKIKIGYLANNLPYSSRTDDGEMGGMMKTLADTLTREFGITVESVCYGTVHELEDALEQGEVDTIGPVYSDFYLAEVKNYVLTSALLTTTPIIIYKNPEFYSNCDVIAVSSESLLPKEVIHVLYPDAELYLCDGIEDSLNAVATGKADSTLVTSLRLNVLRNYRAMDELQFADTPVRTEICLATTKANRVAASILNKGILLSSELLNGVVLAENSYVEKTITFSDFIKRHMTLVFSLVGLIILILGIMIHRLRINGKKLSAALEEAKKANQDALTGIGNRHYFFAKFEELLKSNEKLVLCYCDLDNLKYINDKYGHTEGDLYIHQFVDIIKKQIQSKDIFARIGGDEFCIIFRECNYDTVVKKIHRIQQIFIDDRSLEYPKSFSSGIVEIPDDHDEIEVMDILRQADDLMYEQKKDHKRNLDRSGEK